MKFMLLFHWYISSSTLFLKVNKNRYDSELPYQRPELIEVMEIETDFKIRYLIQTCKGHDWNTDEMS